MPAYGEQQSADSLSRVERTLTLTAQTEHALREAIGKSIFPGGRLPPLVELATQLGVSRETVRLAADRLQQEGLLVKHRRRGTFTQPAPSAVTLEPERSNIIGYIHANYSRGDGHGEAVTRGQGALTLEGAVLEAGRRGFQLLVHYATILELRRALEAATRARRLCGIVLASVAEEKFLRRLTGLKLPAVLVDHDSPVPQLTTLRTDTADSVQLGVKHLTELGHTRIACAYWSQVELNPWFLHGYRTALRGAALRSRRVWEFPVELTPEGADRCLRQWETLRSRPTALIAFNNSFADSVLQSAWRRGIRIPGDLSLFGAGGEEVLGLTCAQIDWRELGRESIRLLTNQIDGGAIQHKVVPYQLRVGRTTGAPGA
jgi:DNA-binding LacI/PurR family transcriptional regulator